MTAGPWDPRAAGPPGHGRLRASDADRERAIDTLKGAFVQGLLTKDELAMRAGQALASRTYAELTAVTADIPVGPAETRPRPKPARPRARGPVNRKAVAWGVCMIVMPLTLGAEFLTYYSGFLIVFVIAVVGMTVTAQP